MKLSNFIPEKKVEDVQWLDKAYRLAAQGWFPLTPKIASILNKERRVKVFHITSPEKAAKLKALEGSKKSISAMDLIPGETATLLSGIWNHGVLYYLEGTLVLSSPGDIMSKPDENGRRWVNFDEQTSEQANKLHSKYIQRVFKGGGLGKTKDKILNMHYNDVDEDEIPTPQELRTFMSGVIDAATEFAQKHAHDILIAFGKIRQRYGEEWNEIVVNQIKLIDVIYDTDFADLNPALEDKIIQSVSGKAIGVDVYKDDPEDDGDMWKIADFIKKRGGRVN